MHCYKELYGADYDGNHGVSIINAELTADDEDDIRNQIILQYEPGKLDYTVTLYCHQYDTEHEFDVSALDYFTQYQLEGFDNET